MPAQVVLEAHAVDATRGLPDEEARARRSRHGPNELAEAAPAPPWRRFLGQFNEVVIWVLIAAAVLSALVAEWADALAIAAIVLLNAILGFLQEERAGRALAALRKLSAPVTRALRGGSPRSVPARELVPGDVIELQAGDLVPADARLIESFGLQVKESSLTGESASVDKDAALVLAPSAPLGDRRNMVYQGTVALVGKASAVVVATGMHTELGRIAGMLQRAHPGPTPLQRRLAELGKALAAACLALAAVVFVVELLRGRALVEVLLLAVSLAVAAVPEGLPAVVTVALALGLGRMVRRNALVRKLPSVETLGCVTVICSDKTGTLTRDEMTVREVVAGRRRYRVTGAGYCPYGHFLPLPEGGTGPGGDAACPPLRPLVEPDLALALITGARCNNARVVPAGEGRDWRVVGDPTEGALIVAALKAGLAQAGQEGGLLWTFPFDSQRKAMSVVVREADGEAVMYAKGAPEALLGKCVAERAFGRAVPLTPEGRRAILQQAAEMGGRALRVLALAYRELGEADGAYREADLVFAGLAGLMDPPRQEAKAAVRRCHEAGIRPVMITGDHPATALAVARELGIAREGDGALTGAELDALSDEELAGRLERAPVFARVSAEHKLRAVRAWKARGQVVAMTGDGVNDAPALQAADIGVAMGLTGTDVAKEASDMVLTDDNFASIVNAVEEGRGIFDNVQKFLHYLLAGNAGLVLFVFACALAGWPFPLTATQVLWINLVTNGLPALALGMEPPEPGLMRRRPRPPCEPIITARRGLLMLAHGALLAAATAVGFWLVYQGQEANLPRARTVAFCVVSYAFLAYSFSCRSQRYAMPQLGLFTNPHLFGAVAVSGLLQLSVVMLPFARPLFEAASHFAWEWALIVLLALAPATLIEVAKLLRHGLGAGGWFTAAPAAASGPEEAPRPEGAPEPAGAPLGQAPFTSPEHAAAAAAGGDRG